MFGKKERRPLGLLLLFALDWFSLLGQSLKNKYQGEHETASGVKHRLTDYTHAPDQSEHPSLP